MDVLEWWCALSVAMDREEEVQGRSFFEAYIAGQYDPKKFPRRRPDYYTIPDPDATLPEGPNVLDSLVKSGIPVSGKVGDVEEYARIRGWKKVYQQEDGSFVDESGNPALPPPGSIFVPVKKKN